MRKLMILLIAFIAVVTFIRAFDLTGSETSDIPVQDAQLQDASLGVYLPGAPEADIGN
jgi:hypothetical protein